MKEKNARRILPKTNALYFIATCVKNEFKKVAKAQGVSASSLVESLMYQYCQKYSKSSEFKNEVKKSEIISTVESGLTMKDMRKQILKIIKG